MSQDSTENDIPLTSSKDTQHVIKLAVTMHILVHAWKAAVNGLPQTPTPTEVQIEIIEQAKSIFNTISQQKSIFIEAIRSVQVTPVPLKKCQPFRTKVLKCVCRSQGPLVSIRKVQKHIKGSIVSNIKIELAKLERDGFGSVKDIKTRSTTRTMFMKIPGLIIDGELRNHSDILKDEIV
ncbi:hypothetical protein LOTGIDRAFT_155058 [Lottia gigantea]|uniref:Uncharacterized protein n=1 Tax=Lottia gigantea TaxID=225164 RepID=V4B9H4_LOTGI|nr:hypothetical protein LOTGIDRAFT_155058 [Lottia gigantea]ESO85569.1 hypothetical protein LOTGIDRAFT_155058 [Lottia gigantea]